MELEATAVKGSGNVSSNTGSWRIFASWHQRYIMPSPLFALG